MAAATGMGLPQAAAAPITTQESAMPSSTNGTLDLADAEQEADHHHADEAQRHEPQRPAAEDEGKDADRDHREDVVDAADRVHEAMQEAGGVAVAGMGEGGSRNEGKQKAENERA